MDPQRAATTHTEYLGDEASVYDWARARVHALNPTAASVWRQCDGATSRTVIAEVLQREMGMPEAEAVVDLTLRKFERLHLLAVPVASFGERRPPTRRWLLERGLVAAMLPVVGTILTPSPLEAQSPGSGPALSGLSPNLGIQGTTVAVTLSGTGFVTGATTLNISGSGVTISNVSVSSATSMTASFVIAAAAPEGPRTVTVRTGARTSGGQTFTVTELLPPGTPALTSVSPNQGVRGTTVAVVLSGTDFVAGATTVNVGGSGVTVNNVVVGSETSLTANLVLAAAADAGQRTVTVTTASGTSGPRFFTILAGAPTLTSVTPNQAIQGTTLAVTLTGTGFVTGATTVAVSGAGVSVTSVVVESGTTLTASFGVDPAAAAGPRNVTVATAAGTSGVQSFTVNPPAGPGTPTLTSVSPNEGVRGSTVAVTLSGTNFVIGATTVSVGSGITATNVVVGSTTSLTASFVLDPVAVVGPRIVSVTTAGGTSAPQAFTINPPPPTLTGLSPNQAIRGETVAVTLTGTNFVVGGTTVAVAGGGVSVSNVLVGSPTSLTASFVLDLAAAAGPRTVSVTTAGGASGGQTFTITLPAPGSQTFGPTGGPVAFTVPAGVKSILVEAVGARGGAGISSGTPGNAGRAVARVSVVPGTVLTVRVGLPGQAGAAGSTAVGGFNGGGPSTGDGGGGGGGATSVRDGEVPLVIAGGGGGGGVGSIGGGGRGGAGGGLAASDGSTTIAGGQPGGGGSQLAAGAGGAGVGGATDGSAGVAGSGGSGGSSQPGVQGGGGGGGGYFGGGGGGGGTPGTGGGGGGSSFTTPGATEVVHQPGSTFGNSVIMSWGVD